MVGYFLRRLRLWGCQPLGWQVNQESPPITPLWAFRGRGVNVGCLVKRRPNPKATQGFLCVAAIFSGAASTFLCAASTFLCAGPTFLCAGPIFLGARLTFLGGAGSVFGSHINDSGFWMYKEFFKLSLKQTFLSWTVMETIISILGLIGVLLLQMIL